MCSRLQAIWWHDMQIHCFELIPVAQSQKTEPTMIRQGQHNDCPFRSRTYPKLCKGVWVISQAQGVKVVTPGVEAVKALIPLDASLKPVPLNGSHQDDLQFLNTLFVYDVYTVMCSSCFCLIEQPAGHKHCYSACFCTKCCTALWQPD